MPEDPANIDPAVEAATFKEQVVAYLDGELDDEGVCRLEALVAAEPKLRRQLVQLEQTWEALDQLGQLEVDETFTQTTLEMVAVAAEDDLQQDQEEAPRKNRRRWLIGGGSLLAAAAVGFLLVILLRPNPNQQLLENLPILQKLDQYQQIDNVEFLKKLYEADREETLFPEVEDGE